MQRFIGFYWTLPVPWAGFTSLPPDVDAAAARSATIRYQRERVRQWVKQEGGELRGEEAFLELDPYTGTEHIVPVVDRLLHMARQDDAQLVLVNFAEVFGWRQHWRLWDRLEQDPSQWVALDPAETLIDGELVDPILHFRRWSDRHAQHKDGKSQHAERVLEAIEKLLVTCPTNAALAKALNTSKLYTHHGKPWTASNLAKFRQSH